MTHPVEVQSETGTEVELEKNNVDNNEDQTENKIVVLEGNSGKTETEIGKKVLNEVEMNRSKSILPEVNNVCQLKRRGMWKTQINSN